VPNGYIATGAGPGAPPYVSIRVDLINSFDQGCTGNVPGSGGFLSPTSDGHTDTLSQVIQAYNINFLGGVSTAAGNFDGDVGTPDSLVNAAGPGGGPHIIIWRMKQLPPGNIVTDGVIDQFMAYDPRFAGGVHITTGDLDGDGRAELIVSPGAGGGPHVKIYSLNPTTNKFDLKYQFMAYDPKFAGGVSISSATGYNTPVEVRQVLSAQLPVGQNPFTEITYTNPSTQPGFSTNPNFNFPLVGSDNPFFGNGGSNTLNAAGTAFLPYITIGSGSIQYLSANLLNGYGNIAYQPNVRDPNNAAVPNTQPLVFASWAANNANIPAWATPGIPYGPFVQTAGGNNPAVTVLTRPPGQVNARNQLVTGAGPGGGPHVKVFDFVNDASGLHIAQQIGFMAFDTSFHGGVNVAIGDVSALPASEVRGFLPDYTSTPLEGRTFPTLPDVYEQFKPEITVTMASGGDLAKIYADFNPFHERRTSITQLNLQPLLIDTQIVSDPGNPLGGFFSILDSDTFHTPIDQQFRGQIYTAVSGLTFDGTEPTAVGSNVFAAGPDPGNFPNRGARVKIFTQLGTSPSYVNLTDVAPTTPAINLPVDDFPAFTSGFFPGGAGGVAFGFGVLGPTLPVEFAPIAITTINNPVLILPPGVELGGGGGPGPAG